MKLICIIQLLLVSLSMENITQKENSYYTIIGYSHTDKYYIKYFDSVCICGKKKKLTTQYLKKNVSCGCMNEYNHNKTHGKTKTPEYKTWQGIKDRCINKNNPSFKYYGERGINVCNEWVNSFESFLNDMGNKPSKNHTIERLDVNKGYSKDNCIWATKKQQANNRRTNYLLTYKRLTKTRAEWADMIGVHVRTLASRCRAEKPIEQILKEYKI